MTYEVKQNDTTLFTGNLNQCFRYLLETRGSMTVIDLVTQGFKIQAVS